MTDSTQRANQIHMAHAAKGKAQLGGLHDSQSQGIQNAKGVDPVQIQAIGIQLTFGQGNQFLLRQPQRIQQGSQVDLVQIQNTQIQTLDANLCLQQIEQALFRHTQCANQSHKVNLPHIQTAEIQFALHQSHHLVGSQTKSGGQPLQIQLGHIHCTHDLRIQIHGALNDLLGLLFVQADGLSKAAHVNVKGVDLDLIGLALDDMIQILVGQADGVYHLLHIHLTQINVAQIHIDIHALRDRFKGLFLGHTHGFHHGTQINLAQVNVAGIQLAFRQLFQLFLAQTQRVCQRTDVNVAGVKLTRSGGKAGRAAQRYCHQNRCKGNQEPFHLSSTSLNPQFRRSDHRRIRR